MVKRVLKFLARIDVFFWPLAWLIVMLVMGTIAQKEIGLYQAQTLYFSSWIYWIGGIIPVPGTMSALTVISLSLAARVFIDDWVWQKAGTLLIHFAALILLVGGFVTSQFSKEGSMVLREGESSAAVQDYFDLELTLEGGPVFKDAQLFDGAVLHDPSLPFEIKVLTRADNATPVMNGEKVDLQPLPRLPEEEENLSAVRIQVGDQVIALFEGIPMNKDLSVDGKDYRIFLRNARRALPFTVQLDDFVKEVYPGTDQARAYHSDVTVRDGDLSWNTRIAMNEPLRYKGYTFYQASFMKTDTEEISVLAVVQNTGRLFPYISSILLGMGLLVHLFQRLPKLMMLALAVVALAAPAHAQERLNMNGFAQLPVLHQGRLQPIDTFARYYLQQFSGQDKMGDYMAVDWLAAVIFAPDLAQDLRVFKINNPDLLRTIDLPWRAEDKLYSFAELREALRNKIDMIKVIEQTAEEDLTPAQTQLMDLQHKLLLYIDLSHSMTVRRPNEVNGFPARLFRIIPAQWNDAPEEWYSPYALTAQGQGSPAAITLIEKWGALALAYQVQSQTQWLHAEKDLTSMMAPYADGTKLRIEWSYNNLSLYTASFAFYLMAGLALMLRLVGYGTAGRVASWGLLGIGWVLHASAIAMRMVILERPPVSTLYESIIFVALIAVVLSALLEWRNKQGLGLLIGSVSGAILLQVGMSYATAGDTLRVLVPVLNTNFWLATHVVMITVGYGACVVTGLLAHVALFKKARGDKGNDLMKNVLAMGLVALLFSVIGTILGGIWADQSWGRFWGWDPKENGAMLICLWLILILHGRIGGLLKPLAFLAGMAFLPVMVGLAWFGVNLLNVGLHSYGFTQGIALNLLLFIVFETIVIAGMLSLIIRRKRTS